MTGMTHPAPARPEPQVFGELHDPPCRARVVRTVKERVRQADLFGVGQSPLMGAFLQLCCCRRGLTTGESERQVPQIRLCEVDPEG